ncbi:MAG: HAMP domain-containing protein [Xanthomonadales bacterium]|jgi:HAMP domain-containing protein|nr:HAMP domain-containing protein [Xanthomonadales bacterium]
MTLSLRSQISLALAALAALFVVALSLQNRAFDQAVADQAMLAEVRAIKARISDIERRGRGYAAVAPRDYESYNRDLLVIHTQWQQDLKVLDQSMASLASGRVGTDNPRLQSLLAELAAEHRRFRQGLAEKLGDNPAEPRLEWGAEFLGAESPKLLQAAEALSAATVALVAEHLAQTRRLTRYTWLVGGLVLIGTGFWFWARVTRRIGRVAQTCRAVAEGAFGQRAPVDGHDELGELSRSFNQLSARTRVVLGVLDRLPEGADAAQAFALLWEESRDYLGHRWQGLFEWRPGSAEGELLLQQEASGIDFGSAGRRFALATILQESGLDQQDSALWSDIRRHTLDQIQGRLLRELSRRDLRTLALVRMRGLGGRPDRLLAFAWADAGAEETGVARFLGGLARFLGRTLGPPAAAT